MLQSPQAQEGASHIADNFIRSFKSTHFLRDMALQRAAFPQTEPWNLTLKCFFDNESDPYAIRRHKRLCGH